MRVKRINRAKGSILALAFVAMVPLVAALGGYAVDVMHVNAERLALQRATDAAALAGANDVINYTGSLAASATAQSGGNEEMINWALGMAQCNPVDGRACMTAGADTIRASAVVASGASPNYNISTSVSAGNPPNACQVIGSMRFRSLLLTIFGNFFGSSPTSFSTLATTSSLAGYLPGVHCFPMAVTLTDVNSWNGKSLKQLSLGGTFWWALKQNAEWTGGPSGAGHSDPVIAAGLTAYGYPGSIPSTLGSFNYQTQGGVGPVGMNTTLDTTNGITSNVATMDSTPVGSLLWMPVVKSLGATPTIIGFVLIQYQGMQPGSPSDFWYGTIVQAVGLPLKGGSGIHNLPAHLLQ
jgi:Flp pilus assembly protein TadG